MGDLLAAAERLQYGAITQLAEELGKDSKTLSNWKGICQRVQTTLRKDIVGAFPENPLSIGHYNLVQAMPENEQRHWLMQTAEH